MNTGRDACAPTQAQVDRWQRAFALGDYAECQRLAQRLVKRCGRDGRSWQLLGLAQSFCGHTAKAIESVKTAARLRPNDATVLDSLGIVLNRGKRFDDARAAFSRSLRLAPDVASVWVNRSNNALDAGNVDEAMQCAKEALRLHGGLPQAHLAWGNALSASGRDDQALQALEFALRLRPDLAPAWLSLGSVFERLGRLQEAVAANQRAAQLSPADAKPLLNLGTLFSRLGDTPASNHCYRRALALDGSSAIAWSNYLYGLALDETTDPTTLFTAIRQFGDTVEAPWRARWGGWKNIIDAERRLRLGFVSGDLRGNHPIVHLVEPVWSLLRDADFDIYAYYAHPAEDATSQRLKLHIDAWRHVATLDDDALDALIRKDAIDILFDISGHTAYNRLTLFARKPAPIQISWLGYPLSTGLTAIDYRIVNSFAAPPGTIDRWFTEKLIRMPATSRFRPHEDLPPVNALPALENGRFTFGSFNRLSKAGDAAIRLWSRVLHEVRSSRMLIGAVDDASARRRVEERFAREGIDASRLSFHERTGMADYLKMHHEVDLLLDTLPFTGGTTTAHALWMGVPTLTLAGPTLPQRQGAGLMERAGLSEWIAHSPEEFVRKAVESAQDPARLAGQRLVMRDRMARMRDAGSSETIATALRSVWRRWCAGKSAAPLDLGSNAEARFDD